MLPITGWKSFLVLAAFVSIPTAIFVPAKHAPAAIGVSEAASPETETPGIPYVKPSPFTLPPQQVHRRPKLVASVNATGEHDSAPVPANRYVDRVN